MTSVLIIIDHAVVTNLLIMIIVLCGSKLIKRIHVQWTQCVQNQLLSLSSLMHTRIEHYQTNQFLSKQLIHITQTHAHRYLSYVYCLCKTFLCLWSLIHFLIKFNCTLYGVVVTNTRTPMQVVMSILFC